MASWLRRKLLARCGGDRRGLLDVDLPSAATTSDTATVDRASQGEIGELSWSLLDDTTPPKRYHTLENRYSSRYFLVLPALNLPSLHHVRILLPVGQTRASGLGPDDELHFLV